MLAVWRHVVCEVRMLMQANALASLSGVCRQLRLMCSSDELWKPLVQRDFSSTVFVDRRTGWKALYGAAVQYREQSRQERRSHARQPRLHPFHRGNPFVPAPPPGFIVGVPSILTFLQFDAMSIPRSLRHFDLVK